jgi:hypothetical protein
VFRPAAAEIGPATSAQHFLHLRKTEEAMKIENPGLYRGALLMAIASLAFVAYAILFLVRSFAGGGFELGVATLNGTTPADLNAVNPAVMHYITHLHVATAGFIAATGIATAALSWYGVRRGAWWALVAAVASPVVGLAVALPYHYTGAFEHNWVTHLGPIYVATVVFVIGAVQALLAMVAAPSTATGAAPGRMN